MLVRDGVLSRRVHRQTTDVDADVLARQRHDQGLLDGVERQVEVAGEQVARAARQRAERGLGPHERRGDGPHRPVPAEGTDHRGALLDGPSRLAGTRVGDGRLEPDRLAPTLRQTGRGDPRPDGVEIGELRRVDDDPGPLQRGRILVETLGAEVVAVGAAATSGDPRGLQNGVTPGDDDRDDDRENDERDDDPERRAVEHRPTLAGADAPRPGSRFER